MSDTTEFAKLFNINGRQLLVYLTEGSDKDYEFHQVARASFGGMDAVISFDVSENAPDDYDAFERYIGGYTEEKARSFMAEVEAMERRISERSQP